MALPVAAIVCIVLACWVLVVLAIFGLYQFLKYRGNCECECKLCGSEDQNCCSCCKSLSESCNCCNPSIDGCLNSCCPKKKVSCVDIVLCQCCAEEGKDSCVVNTFPCCQRDGPCCQDECCSCCSDNCCSCCQDCGPVTLCCLEVRLVSNHNGDKYERKSSENTLNSQSRDKKEIIPKLPERTKMTVKGTQSVTKKTEMKKQQSPLTARSLRSISLIDTSITPRPAAKQQRTGKPKTKIKATLNVKSSPKKPLAPQTQVPQPRTKNTGKTKQRSLPKPPTPRVKSDSVETSSSSSSASSAELKEVPVVHDNVSFNYSVSSARYASVQHNDPDLVLGLPQQSDLLSLSSRASHHRNYSNNSNELYKPGSVIDGSISHRSVGTDSVFSSVAMETYFDMALTSPRP